MEGERQEKKIKGDEKSAQIKRERGRESLRATKTMK